MTSGGVFSADGKSDTAPRHASTVIVLRAGAGGLEVVLQKRGRGNQFMAGAYVFPGGKLDEADCAPATLARLPEGAVAACAARLRPTPGTTLAPETAAGLYVAGCRETFEEAGVLLAHRADGRKLDGKDPGVQAMLDEARARLVAEELDFAQLLADEDLVLDVDGLVYWAHWITPSMERRRFDTRFFVALAPPGQAATSDGLEVADMVWMTPGAALAAHEQGRMFLPPPTQRNLQEMGDVTDFDALRRTAEGRDVQPILPKLAAEDGRITILLPWDPEYPEAKGDALPGPAPEDPHPELPSRIFVAPRT